MKLSKIGRILTATVASAALGLGMTACGGGTIGYLWVAGTYYNQITGFKIDDYTGNLTAIPHSPFAAGGNNPAMVVVKPNGRFLYVINSGSTATAPTTAGGTYTQTTAGNISEFSIGGDGVLTFQQNFTSQGTHPIWGTFDSTGNYFYVLDKYGPDGNNPTNGSITAFSVASDTGRLSLLPNSSVLNSNGTPTTYFPVGPNAIQSKVSTAGCLFTLEPNTIYPYVLNSSNGQLTLATTGTYTVSGSSSLSSLNVGNGSGSSFIYATDSGANQIFSLQAGGTTCSLTPISGSQQSNLAGTANPVNSITVSGGGGYRLYVLNQSSTNSTTSTANSSISAFTINTLGQLQTLSDSSNPYTVGSGPVCAVMDPTNQYMYISNNSDSTLTGKLVDSNRGVLSQLSRGSVFPTTTNPTCLAVSGNL